MVRVVHPEPSPCSQLDPYGKNRLFASVLTFCLLPDAVRCEASSQDLRQETKAAGRVPRGELAVHFALSYLSGATRAALRFLLRQSIVDCEGSQSDTRIRRRLSVLAAKAGRVRVERSDFGPQYSGSSFSFSCSVACRDGALAT